jgi:uncharacterized protein DUF4426
MTFFQSISSALTALLLTACSGAEPPRAADIVAPAETTAAFGDLRVHYNALSTLSLNDAVAREYAVEKDAGTGMLVIALRQWANGQEIPADGEVSAIAYDLQGARQQIAFKAVKTGAYTDHIGTFDIHPRDSYRFEVALKANGRSETVKFQRNF